MANPNTQPDRQQSPQQQPPRREGRMGGMLTFVLILIMGYVIVKTLQPPAGDQSERTFHNLVALAYRGDVNELRIKGERKIDAKVVWKGRAVEWEGVPIPEYATEQLAELERIANRDIMKVSLQEAMQAVTSGAWRLESGYTINPPRTEQPPKDLTGLFIEYTTNGQSRWSQVRGDPNDRRVDEFIELAASKDVAIRPAPVGYAERVIYEPDNEIWGGLLLTFVPWLILMAFFLFMFTRMRGAGGGGGIMSFGRSRVKMIAPDQAKITFDQVAGVEEAKEEVQEIVSFLKDPKKFSRLGGRVPRGVLLVGPPGTGKTLLAKAIAGEANVPFFSISGSDFVEMFVGVGASRVRDLFKQARDNAPCVIFLDEIDAVGRKRGAGLGGGHDEREQTLNAMLVEMDGFDTDAGVIMIAATNRPDVLDPALLRPGRFDRQIMLDLPDIRGREAVLVVHSQNVVMSPEVDLSEVARGTPMFSGAELEALINEAALIATLKEKTAIEQDDLDEARDKVRFGRQKKSRVVIDEDRRVTAYHEAGHALVAARLKGVVEPVHKVTIIPRGMALGATMQLPERDKYHHRKRELLGMLTVLYGGRVAEELFCDDISGGAANDIERATEIARAMVCSWGMSDALGPVAYGEQRGEVFLGDELMRNRNYSEDTSQAIDREVRGILDGAHGEAREILETHRDAMERLANALLTYETITGQEVEALMEGKSVADLRPAEPPTGAGVPPVGGSPSTTRVAKEADDEEDEGLEGTVPVPGPA